MKKLFAVFALAIAVMFVTSINASAVKDFEMIGTITEIQYARFEGDCLVEVCLIVDVGQTVAEYWPIQIDCDDNGMCGVLNQEEMCSHNTNLILKHMIAGDWAYDAMQIILDITMRRNFTAAIVGFQYGDREDCQECPWCQNTDFNGTP